VAKVEIEKAQLDADLASSDLRLLIEQQRKAWEIEAQNMRQQILELRTKLSLLHNQSKNYTILAPSDGVLLQASGIKAGSYILPGQQLAFLSTQDSLLAEVYVPANQIGYLQKGMIVRLLIDAYNFHEWGIINGKVQEISSEIKIINKIPVLVASVSLAQQELKLKNGYKGKLKKGMTLSAHFTLQRRSLLSLLYDKAEDWLDPRKSSKQ
jgi:HlyD family secretion protein